MRKGKMTNMTFVKEIGNETSISVCSAEKSKWLLRISESAKNFEIHKFRCTIVRSFQRANPAMLKKIIYVVSVIHRV